MIFSKIKVLGAIAGALLISLAGSAQGVVPDATEKAALLALYNSTNGATWSLSEDNKWTVDKINDYPNTALYGIEIENGDVTSVNLDNIGVGGSLPSDFNTLTALEYVSMRNNELNGALPTLSSLTKLKLLDLVGANFSGVIPSWLGSLVDLEVLNLSNNYTYDGISLTGPIPVELTTLPKLKQLYLLFNDLSAPNSIPAAFSNLDNLELLDLSHCKLTPASVTTGLTGLQKLRDISLNANSAFLLADGAFPDVLADLPSLERIYLELTNVKKLPASFSLLPSLNALDLNQNDYSNSAVVSDIVSVLKNCLHLKTLQMSYCKIDDMPSDFYLLSTLEILHLSNNPLNPSQCEALGQLPHLRYLNVYNCGLTGLPVSLVNCTTLETLYAPYNKLYPLPTHLQNIPNLKDLYLSHNGIQALPAWFGAENMSSIRYLLLDNNAITLPLPDNFSLLTNLIYLDISYNNLSGSLPAYFSSFNKIYYFRANNNTLTNPLPDMSSWNSLNYVFIQHNEFSGVFPAYLSNATVAKSTIDISFNHFSSFPVYKPNFTSNLGLIINNNELDFGDIEPNFEGVNNPKAGSITYSPQSVLLGEETTIYAAEGLTANFSITTPGNENIYKLQKLEGSIWIDSRWTPSFSAAYVNFNATGVTEDDAGTYRYAVTNNWATLLTLYSKPIYLIIIPPLCQSAIPAVAGAFKMDKLTGAIVFDRADCPAEIPLTCMYGPSQGFDNIVSASATTHADQWAYTYLADNAKYTGSNPFDYGARGKWRPKANYAYNTAVNQANDKNYNAGTFKFKVFDWKHGEASGYPGWLLTNQVEKYSPNGDPVEERNAIGIPSAAKFGYRDAMPYLIAQNAEYNSLLFESFENVYGNKFEDGFLVSGGRVDESTRHAGKSSFRLNGITTVPVRTFTINSQIKAKGMLVKLWMKSTMASGLQLQVFSDGTSLALQDFSVVARTGEWSLYQALISAETFASLQADDLHPDTFVLKILQSTSTTSWIDDIRVQPADAEMTAYVYDKNTLRLLTVFDDQHFGMYYQYNAEGKLIRKMIETERGLRTLQETQYNTPLITK